jgi:hypothetical protein
VAVAGELWRLVTERVPQGHPSRFLFVDPAFFERPTSTQPWDQRPPLAATTEMAVRRVPDPTAIDPHWGGVQRRATQFDAREVFLEPTVAHNREITLYS